MVRVRVRFRVMVRVRVNPYSNPNPNLIQPEERHSNQSEATIPDLAYDRQCDPLTQLDKVKVNMNYKGLSRLRT